MKKLLHTNKLWSRMAALLLSCMVLLPGMATAEGDQCLEPYADPITLSMIYGYSLICHRITPSQYKYSFLCIAT